MVLDLLDSLRLRLTRLTDEGNRRMAGTKAELIDRFLSLDLKSSAETAVCCKKIRQVLQAQRVRSTSHG